VSVVGGEGEVAGAASVLALPWGYEGFCIALTVVAYDGCRAVVAAELAGEAGGVATLGLAGDTKRAVFCTKGALVGGKVGDIGSASGVDPRPAAVDEPCVGVRVV
jgi:hypothetical protein